MKGQSAVEFIILIGALVFLITSFFVIINLNIVEKQKEQRTALLNDLALTIQNEIQLANTAQEGYRRTFVLPKDLVGKNYSITLLDGLVYIKTIDEKEALSLPILNISGSLNPGTNLLRKDQGLVYANA